MKNGFYKETNGIYRLRIPFERIYTSVFLITTNEGAFLVDCATTSEDVDHSIVPSLRELGYELSELCALVLTHKHGDHAGGLKQVLSYAPNIEVIQGVRPLWDGLCTYPMPGHTKDCIGILDMRSHTLISGDGLQGAGVDIYRCSTKDPAAYLETIQRIQRDKRIENILFSHNYEPWNKDHVFGRHEVEKCLTDCLIFARQKS